MVNEPDAKGRGRYLGSGPRTLRDGLPARGHLRGSLIERREYCGELLARTSPGFMGHGGSGGSLVPALCSETETGIGGSILRVREFQPHSAEGGDRFAPGSVGMRGSGGERYASNYVEASPRARDQWG